MTEGPSDTAGTPPDINNGRGSSDDDRRGLPERVVDQAERLTRLARNAVDGDEREAYREDRANLLDEHDFTARVRTEDDTLVLHPEAWVEDGVVRPDRVDDLDRAVEISLSGPGDPEEWATVEEHNRSLVATVREDHGDVHGDTAAAFADFMGNHYAKRVEATTADELREFVEEYFPRNAWPTEEQQTVLGRSIELVFEAAGGKPPEI